MQQPIVVYSACFSSDPKRRLPRSVVLCFGDQALVQQLRQFPQPRPQRCVSHAISVTVHPYTHKQRQNNCVLTGVVLFGRRVSRGPLVDKNESAIRHVHVRRQSRRWRCRRAWRWRWARRRRRPHVTRWPSDFTGGKVVRGLHRELSSLVLDPAADRMRIDRRGLITAGGDSV